MSVSGNPLTRATRSAPKAFVADMVDSIFVTYVDAKWLATNSEDDQQKELKRGDFARRQARDLARMVSVRLALKTGGSKQFEKIVVLKEDDRTNLRTRLSELLKAEDCKLVNYGIFSALGRSEVLRCFEACCKVYFRQSPRQRAVGRIWCAEINGSGLGCGVVAADDKIFVWRDMKE